MKQVTLAAVEDEGFLDINWEKFEVRLHVTNDRKWISICGEHFDLHLDLTNAALMSNEILSMISNFYANEDKVYETMRLFK